MAKGARMDGSDAISTNFIVAAGTATVLLGSCLAYVVSKSKGQKSSEADLEVEEVEVFDKTKYPGGHITIYYGSQTGTAETFGKDIEREGEENGFKIEVVDLEDIEDDIIDSVLNNQKKDDRGKNRAIFMMATYGEGEPTDNAVSFIRFLKEDTGDGAMESDDSEEKKGEEDENTNTPILEHLEYAVFGLGNKQYEQYNETGKQVDALLKKGGASRIVKLGLGDDDDDLEGDFENWKDNILWPSLKKKYNPSSLVSTTTKGATKLPECHCAIEYLDGPSSKDHISAENIQMSSKQYFTATNCAVQVKRELRSPADDGSTLHIEIDATELKYQTADNLAILPVNDDSIVERVAKAMDYDLSAYFRLIPAKGHESKYAALFPTPCTVHECLARYCDLVGPPRRSELKRLAAYAKDPTCQKALLRLSSKEGKAEYKEKIMDAKIGMVDIISKLCPSVSMPLEHFVSVCPRLQARFYTISSSSTVHPNSIHATVSVLKENRDDGSTFKGVCSNYLSDIIKNGKVCAFTRDSTFRLPSDSSKPILMVGPGTGIAPMRALLQERSHQRNVQKLDVGSNILYFGCKNRDLDFIYSDELNEYEKDGILTKMYLAFSREQNEKVYVQHLLKKNSKETFDLINEQGAYVYVCGGVRMGQDVSEALRKLVAEHGNYSTNDAKKYVEEMTSSGRYVQELWA
jgi:NADPH-ferrihemoprotein reductase